MCVYVDQGVPLIIFQECGIKGAAVVSEALGTDYTYFATGSEDPVATFWDTRVARIFEFGKV